MEAQPLSQQLQEYKSRVEEAEYHLRKFISIFTADVTDPVLMLGSPTFLH